MFRRKAAPVFTKSPIERVPHTSGSMNAGDFLKIYFTWVYLNTITPPILEKMENFRTTEERVREISRFPGKNPYEAFLKGYFGDEFYARNAALQELSGHLS